MKKLIVNLIAVMCSVNIGFMYIIENNVSAEGDTDTIQDYIQQVWELVNAERVKQNLSPLVLNDDLNEVSEIRANEITEEFSHLRPDGTLCDTVLAEYGLSTYHYGENIAYTTSGYSDIVSVVVEGWLNSEGHRENILNESYTNIGVGIAYMDGLYYWVQTFSSDIRKVSTEIVWNISDGVLKISGVGNMSDYGYNDNHAPWYSEKDTINKAVITNGVKYIGDYAFIDCKYITTVELPQTVTGIGMGTFENCYNLNEITLTGLKEIGDYSFRNCEKLSYIYVPDSVKNIGYSAFSNCNGLESITIMNPDCIIADSEETISNTAVIYGYINSTAKEYAEKYNRKFVGIDILYGDANEDGEVTIADSVLIMQSLSNADEYSISETGLLKADVLDIDGVSSADALIVQMVVANTISADSLPLMSEELTELIN